MCSEWREYVSGVSKVQSILMRLKVGEHSLSKGDLPDEASAALLPVSPQLLSCTFFHINSADIHPMDPHQHITARVVLLASVDGRVSVQGGQMVPAA